MTITENKEKLNGHISWIGDGNNVLHDLLLASVSMGHDFSYATPLGYEPDKMIIDSKLDGVLPLLNLDKEGIKK